MSDFIVVHSDDVKIAEREQVNNLINLMARNSVEYDNLLGKISSALESLELEINYKQKYDVILGVEFLLFKLRVKVTFETMKVKHLLGAELPVSVQAKFKQRSEYLSTYLIRLNEIRDEVAVIQKMVYTKNVNY